MVFKQLNQHKNGYSAFITIDIYENQYFFTIFATIMHHN